MGIPLRVLVLEDRPADAELILHELRQAGFELDWQRVETELDYVARLHGRLDVILAAYSLPQFDAPRALKLLQEKGLDIPFIVVTETISEEAAVECMRQGAADYLLKDRLTRLGQAVTRVLQEKKVRDGKRQAEAALRGSEEFYKLISENMNDAIFLLDVEGRLLFANKRAEELTGYTTEELLGRPIFSLLGPEDAQVAKARLETARTGAEIPSFVEREIIRKDGSRVWVEANITSVVTKGRVVGSLGVWRDISERKLLQERLIQAEKLAALGELVAGIAHELNNPLTTMVGHAQLLRMSQQDPKVASRVERIAEAAQRATRIVRNFLTAAGKHSPERVAVSVNEIVAKTLELFSYQLRVNDIEVETALAPNLPETAGDPYQLQQVILNLVSNATQAMAAAHRRGRLRVASELSPDRSTIRIMVSDDGPGISPDHLPKIFDPFFTTKLTGEGTGLGLAVARGIMRDHGGNITVESAPGQGTTFMVALPITTPSVDDAAPAPARAIPNGLRVLVVEDEAELREMMVEAIGERGGRVETAASGSEALEILARSSVGVLVLDIRMPEMSGTDLWTQINRMNPALARRTLFCTGDVVGEATRAFIEQTGCLFVSKPFEWGRFFNAVAEAASR